MWPIFRDRWIIVILYWERGGGRIHWAQKSLLHSHRLIIYHHRVLFSGWWGTLPFIQKGKCMNNLPLKQKRKKQCVLENWLKLFVISFSEDCVPLRLLPALMFSICFSLIWSHCNLFVGMDNVLNTAERNKLFVPWALLNLNLVFLLKLFSIFWFWQLLLRYLNFICNHADNAILSSGYW